MKSSSLLVGTEHLKKLLTGKRTQRIKRISCHSGQDRCHTGRIEVSAQDFPVWTWSNKSINGGSGIKLSWVDFFRKINKRGGTSIPDLRVFIWHLGVSKLSRPRYTWLCCCVMAVISIGHQISGLPYHDDHILLSIATCGEYNIRSISRWCNRYGGGVWRCFSDTVLVI